MSKAVLLKKVYLSLFEESKKIRRTLKEIDILDYVEARRSIPPLYVPTAMRKKWLAERGLKHYTKGIFFFPFQRYELANTLSLSSIMRLEKEIFYTVVEGEAIDIKNIASRVKDKYIVTPSKFSKEMVEKGGLKVDEVIPHQASPLKIDYEYGKRWRRKLPKDKKILTYIGNPVMRKGLLELKKAVEILSKKRNDFLVVIHTANQPRLQGYDIKELEYKNIVLELEFGKISKSQALAKVYYSDFYIHPAKGEGFGLPVLEAMQLGKPVICINAFGVNEIANHENSFMVEPYGIGYEIYPPYYFHLIKFKVVKYKPEDLAEMMDIALSSSKDTLNEKIVKGYETVKRFENTYKRFEELLS